MFMKIKLHSNEIGRQIYLVCIFSFGY